MKTSVLASLRLSNQAKNKKLLTIVLVVAIVLVIDLTITGFLKFGYYVVKCGGLPVVLVPGSLGANASYELPGSYSSVWAIGAYVCTEQEAIDREYEKGLNSRLNEFKARSGE